MPTLLEPQDALEQAVLAAILAAGEPGGTAYPANQVKQMFDGTPEPRCGNVFVAVWSEGWRGSQSRTSLDELFQVFVTVTIRCTQPFDRWLHHRQDLERRINRIRALIFSDMNNYNISNQASALAGYDQGAAPRTVGFREALAFDGCDRVETKGPDWFSAEAGDSRAVGLAQRIRFGRGRRVQALLTMS
jgi:hypothetical protein